MQMVFASFGGVMAGRHMYENRYIPPPPRLELPPADDKRLTLFREKFCYANSGPCAGALADNFATVKNGFRLDVHLHGAPGTTATLLTGTFRGDVAKLYDVAADQVTIEYIPGSRSEARARVTVIETTELEDKPLWWNGRSTYNVKTGTCEIGKFVDRQRAHWQLHAWDSGAFGGVLAGLTGSGKTGTALRLALEMGLAKMCTCGRGPDCDCPEPQLERFIDFWMADPQRQPFSVFKGRCTLTAWGPEASMEMLRWGVEVGKDRAAEVGSMEWFDHLGRQNFGKGWFNPYPGFPLTFLFVDEWPLVAQHPEIGKLACEYATTIGSQFRKTGIALILMTGLPDLEYMGPRAVREMLLALNAISHRTDQLSKNMLGIEGEPKLLQPGVPGLGYINGPDRRSGTKFRTGYIPEYAKPGYTGPDVRGLAELTFNTPVRRDPVYEESLRRLGWTGPGMVLDSAELLTQWEAERRENERQAAAQQEAKLAGVAAQAAQQTPAQYAAVKEAVYNTHPDDLEAAVHALQDGAASVYDVMELTGMDALRVRNALNAAVTTGTALKDPAGRYVACV
jgi:hypothetical protein